MLAGIFLRYLLFPILSFGLAWVALVISRKNELISRRALILFILLAALVMAAPGLLGFAGLHFHPWLFLAAQLIYLGLGAVFVQAYDHYFGGKATRQAAWLQVLTIAIITLLGGYLFALLFGLVSAGHASGYAAAACVLAFPLPALFYATYLAFLHIPFEIYTVWAYPLGSDEISFDGLDFNRLMLVDLELSRQPGDRERMHVKAKAPGELAFGDWFKKFLDDYNEKFPQKAIAYIAESGEPNGWAFYTKRSFFSRRQMIDPAGSIMANRIREDATVIAKRVFEHTEEIL